MIVEFVIAISDVKKIEDSLARIVFRLHPWFNLKIITYSDVKYFDSEYLKTLLDLISIKFIKKELENDCAILRRDTYHYPAPVLLGWDSVETRNYIPPPVCCCRCQEYTHIASDCCT